MPNGGSYVKNPGYDPNEIEQYSTVQAYTSSGNSITIPSGASIVQGIYYMWNDQGFTGQGWMYTVSGGPTNMYSDFKSDQDVAAYVANNGNLDAVFSSWAQDYTLEGWHNFYMEVHKRNSNCMDVVQSAAQ